MTAGVIVNKNNDREVEYRAARTYRNPNMWRMWENQMIIPEFRAYVAYRLACLQNAYYRFYYWIGRPDIQKERNKYQHPRKK